MEAMQRTEGNKAKIVADIAKGRKTEISQRTISGNAHKQMTYIDERSSTVTLEAIP